MISNKIITFLFYILFLFLQPSCCIKHDDWVSTYDLYDKFLPNDPNPLLKKMVTKKDGNLKFTVNSSMSIADRENAIATTKEYIKQCLALINEPEFEDSIHITLVNDISDIRNLTGREDISGEVVSDIDGGLMVVCIYGVKHNPLKHELMHVVSFIKWGIYSYPQWLNEGLATFSDPDSWSCDGHTLEERYVYFLQTDKLLEESDLISFPDNLVEKTIAYNQSAYIVGYLYNNYGVEKLKTLWQSGTEQFEKIYGLSFEQITTNISDELNKKYPVPIQFDLGNFL